FLPARRRCTTTRASPMRVRARALSVLATLTILGSSACQPAAPAAEPAADNAVAQPLATAVDAARVATPTSVTNSAAPTAASSAVGPAVTPRPSPTSLPTLPTSVLGSLPADQAQIVRDGHAALAGGDFPRAIGLLEPVVNQFSGQLQAEVRLIYGQAL